MTAIDCHIRCKIENIQLSFANMTIKLNMLNIAKQPYDPDEEIVYMDLIKELVNHTPSNLSDDFS